MNAAIFKAYDIRGLAGKEIDASVARRLGKVLAELYKPKQVLIGRDMRQSSDELEEALIDGLRVSGVHVTKIGLCSTPIFNSTLHDAQGGYDLGVMVTASHNPAAYNGFKITKGDCLPIGKGSGMEEVQARCLSEEPIPDSLNHGALAEDAEAVDRYIKKIIRLSDLGEIKTPIRIVMDAGNGMNGIVTPKLVKEVKNIESIGLFLEPDGTFPNHEANPLNVETLKDLRHAVKKYEAAFGVAFDGDGDRVGFVDEKGEPIPGDILTALFASLMLKQQPGGLVLYDVRSSWSVPEIIQEHGGTPRMCKVGHANIKKQMREEKALFAGELSMHFYFRDIANCESSDLALLLMIKLLTETQKPLSSIWKHWRRYAHSGERNFEIKNPQNVIAAIRERYQSQATNIYDFDGIRCEFRFPEQPEKDWWFSLRASNTEPLLRVNLEARTPEQMEAYFEEIASFIQSQGGSRHT